MTKAITRRVTLQLQPSETRKNNSYKYNHYNNIFIIII